MSLLLSRQISVNNYSIQLLLGNAPQVAMASPAFHHLQSLLRKRGLDGTLPAVPGSTSAPAPAGLDILNQYLGGGFARGALTEISSTMSSGATGVAFTTLAAATQRGEATAYIDATNSFHAESAALANVCLARLLVVRCRIPHQAWDAVNLVSSAGGFGLIVLDLLGLTSRNQLREWQNRSWMKLQRSLENTTTVLLLLSPQRGLCAQPPQMRLELDAIRIRWYGNHPIASCLAGMESSLRVGYQRRYHPTLHSARQQNACLLFLKDANAGSHPSSTLETTHLTGSGITPFNLMP